MIGKHTPYGSPGLEALLKRAARERWIETVPLGPDLVGMRPWNGTLPTKGYRKTQVRKPGLIVGETPAESRARRVRFTVEWTESTDFSKDFAEDRGRYFNEVSDRVGGERRGRLDAVEISKSQFESWRALIEQWRTAFRQAGDGTFVGRIRGGVIEARREKQERAPDPGRDRVLQPWEVTGQAREKAHDAALRKRDPGAFDPVERIIRVLANQSFEALTAESDEWREPNIEICELDALVREKQIELDRKHPHQS